MYAAYYGHEDAVLLLHSCAVNLHARNTSGLTALMLASVCGHPSVVKVLIEVLYNMKLLTVTFML